LQCWLGLKGPNAKSVKYTIRERVCKQGDCGEGGQIWFGVSMKDGPRLCAPTLPLIRGVAIIFLPLTDWALDKLIYLAYYSSEQIFGQILLKLAGNVYNGVNGI
jgi:hypothetical protein